MFLGHFGVALAAKKVAPRTSLATLFLGAQLVDLVWPILVLAGVERVRVEPGNTAFTPLDFESYPVTHSLALDLVWSVALGAVYYALRRDRRGAVTVGALVLSHWVLDLVTHRPDLPLWPGGSKVGLGLWDSVAGTLVVELAIFLGGVALYAASTRARNAVGRWAFAALVAFFLLVYVANVLGPPPPSSEAVGATALAMWLFVPWAWWIDRNRDAPVAIRA